MTTPFSYRTYTGDASKNEFAVPFPYLKRAHVKVTVATVLQVDGTDYEWSGDSAITFLSGKTPAADAEILVYRETPESDQIVQWANGSYIVAEDLNESDLQWLYLIQEHHDQIHDIEGILGPTKSLITTAQATADPTNPAWDSDQYLAAAGAIDRVYSQEIGDGSGYPGAGNKGKGGRLRIDNTGAEPKLFYWDAAAASPAWVEIDVEGPAGPQGPQGDIGPAPGLQTPSATAIPVPVKPDGSTGTPAASVSQDSNGDLQFAFEIPVGESGADGSDGSAATVEVGSTTTLTPGSPASVTNGGTSSAAILNFGIPQGMQGQVGETGTAATITVGSTTTGNPGSAANVVNAGSSSAAVLNFTIPRGEQGPPGEGVNYKGPIDAVTTPAPAAVAGDFYVSTSDGTPTTGWTGVSAVVDGTRLIFNGTTSQWDAYHPLTSDVQLSYLPAVDKGTVVNSIGSDAVIPLVDATNAGLIQPADKAKIDSIVPASETAQGIIEIATQAETDAGTDDYRAVTPKKLKANIQSLVPPSANDGQINISGGIGIEATGSNATANQSVNTTRTISVDTTWLGGWIDDNRPAAESNWTRTGTTLRPKVSTDTVSAQIVTASVFDLESLPALP